MIHVHAKEGAPPVWIACGCGRWACPTRLEWMERDAACHAEQVHPGEEMDFTFTPYDDSENKLREAAEEIVRAHDQFPDARMSYIRPAIERLASALRDAEEPA